MSETVYGEARAWAVHWAQRWFLGADGEDRLTLDSGVAAGWATQVEAFPLLLDFALGQLGAPREPASVPTRLRGVGFDRSIRSFGLRVVARSGRPARPLQRGVAFVTEFASPSALEPARLVAHAIPSDRRALVCADPRAYRALRRAGLDPTAMLLPLREQRRCLASDGPRTLEVLADLQARPPVMLLDGKNVAREALAQLGRFLGRSLPWLAVEHRALLRAIGLTRPRSIAITSDQHRIGRLATQVGMECGIRVTALQHGLPQEEFGFLPVVADQVAVWSPLAADWFAQRGTDREHLAILGNPRFDSLAADRTETDRAATPEPRLLLALSVAELSTNSRVVSAALGLLNEMPTAQLVIKLHPGYREWGWVDQLVGRASCKKRVRIVHHEELSALLRWASVTLVHQSTVALDSLVAGTPVVVVLSDAPSVADIELADLGLPRAAEPQGLATAIAPLLEPGARQAWLMSRERSITQAAGPLDGRSAERVAALLLEEVAATD